MTTYAVFSHWSRWYEVQVLVIRIKVKVIAIFNELLGDLSLRVGRQLWHFKLVFTAKEVIK